MVHFCIFGGYEGKLHPDKRFFLTLFGAAELHRPTLARQMVAQRQRERTGEPPPQRPLFVTIFGGTEIKAPTLAEEYLDLRELLDNGTLTLQDWENSLAALAQSDVSPASFTMFGGFSESELPSDNVEIDAIAIHQHLGNISASASRVLQLGIGQGDIDRRALVRQAAMADRAA